MADAVLDLLHGVFGAYGYWRCASLVGGGANAHVAVPTHALRLLPQPVLALRLPLAPWQLRPSQRSSTALAPLQALTP